MRDVAADAAWVAARLANVLAHGAKTPCKSPVPSSEPISKNR
jgi:hypothetical protein